jgi:hypothetical protein
MTAQTKINFGKKARDKGIAKAIRHADAVSPTWSDRAYAYLQAYLSRQREPFQTESFRYWVEGRLEEPPNKRAFGSVILRAANAGLIEKVGIKPVTNPKANMAFAALWQRI